MQPLDVDAGQRVRTERRPRRLPAEGVQLAADEINAAGGVQGRKVRLIIEDDQGRAEDAASVVTKLITRDDVIAVIGENSSNQSLAAAPVCQNAKVPMIYVSHQAGEIQRLCSQVVRIEDGQVTAAGGLELLDEARG